MLRLPPTGWQPQRPCQPAAWAAASSRDPAGPPNGRVSSRRALVFVSHGAGEHCGRYDELAQMLVGLGLLVCAHDHGEYRPAPGPPVCRTPPCSLLGTPLCFLP